MKIKKKSPKKEELEKYDLENWTKWECEPSKFDWSYDDGTETCYVKEGHVIVTTPDGQEVEIKPGDLVQFPEGLKTKWDVKKKISKVYTFEEVEL